MLIVDFFMRLLISPLVILLLTLHFKGYSSDLPINSEIDTVLSYISSGQIEQAKKLIFQLEQRGNIKPTYLASLYYVKAKLLEHQNNTADALRLLEQAEKLSISINDPILLHRCLLSRELIFTEQGKNDSAAIICYRRLELNRLQHNYLALSDNFRALNSLLTTHLYSHSANGLIDSWNNDGITPAHHNAYTKVYIYHWATASELTTTTSKSLPSSKSDETAFYRINTPTTNEFYLLENRQQEGFDAYIPGHVSTIKTVKQ